jgi:hypothetical protein
MVIGNTSRKVCCTLVYLRREREDGQDECKLITNKTQAAPRVKIAGGGCQPHESETELKMPIGRVL